MIEKDGIKFGYNNEGIDDSTFNLWKTELKKELPYFWELMIRF